MTPSEAMMDTKTLKALLDKATSGEWGVENTGNSSWIGPMRTDGKVAKIVVKVDTDQSYRVDILPEKSANAAAIVAAVNWCRTTGIAAADERDALRAALFSAIALIGQHVPMDKVALVAGKTLVARDVWKKGKELLFPNARAALSVAEGKEG